MAAVLVGSRSSVPAAVRHGVSVASELRARFARGGEGGTRREASLRAVHQGPIYGFRAFGS